MIFPFGILLLLFVIYLVNKFQERKAYHKQDKKMIKRSHTINVFVVGLIGIIMSLHFIFGII